jgi:hypothetical protein
MIVHGPLFIACRDAATLFEPIDQPLDLVALTVERTVKRPGPPLITLARNRDPDPMPPQVLPDRPATIALIADQPAGASLGASPVRTLDRALRHQWLEHHRFMPLTRRQEPRERLPVALSPEMNFGAEAALATP